MCVQALVHVRVCWQQSCHVTGAGAGGGGRSPLPRGLVALGEGVRNKWSFSWGHALSSMARRWGNGTTSSFNTALFIGTYEPVISFHLFNCSFIYSSTHSLKKILLSTFSVPVTVLG